MNKYLLLCLLAIMPMMPAISKQQRTLEKDLIHTKHENHVRIIVIRHGQGVHNIKDIMTSSLSPGIHLTKEGEKQVRKAALSLRLQKIDFIYISPTYRTLQTAHIIGEYLKIPYHKMIVDERLREQFFGDCEGYTWQEYESIFPPLEDLNQAAPNGESGLEVMERTREFLRQIITQHPQKTILIVTHGYNCSLINQCLKGRTLQIGTAGYTIYE